jgi:hypothetical protein
MLVWRAAVMINTTNVVDNAARGAMCVGILSGLMVAMIAMGRYEKNGIQKIISRRISRHMTVKIVGARD